MTDPTERPHAWDAERPGESPTERLDRNWADLLQELRVTQTGIQLLTAFLLTLPFQQRFTALDRTSQRICLGTVAAAITATAFLVAPVAVHRVLFRRHARRPMVAVAHRCALAGLALLAVCICGVSYTVTSLVLDDLAGGVAAGVAATVLGALWVALPLVLREQHRA